MTVLLSIAFASSVLAAIIQRARGCDMRNIITSAILSFILGPLGLLISLWALGKYCPSCRSNIHPGASKCPSCQSPLVA